MASVTYKIGGKYDGKAVHSALKDFGSLTKAVKGLAVVKVFNSLNSISQATKKVFVEQNKALTTFNTAVIKSGKSLEKLNNLKSQLSKGNFIDDDSLNNAMALGVQMGLTNEQLEKVMKTAVDMAASGVMPLDQAVQSLGKTFNGSLGTLSKVAPELSNLSKEEIENGKAVDILMDKYSGFADAMSNTFSGRETQWSNSVADLKAAIGSIPQSLEFITQGKLLEPLQNVTKWIVDNRNYIINFFLHIPQVVTAALNLVKDVIAKTFTGKSILNIIEALVISASQAITDLRNYFGSVAQNIFEITVNIITDLAKIITEKLKAAFTGTTDGFNNALLDALGNFFQQVVKIIDYIQHPHKAVIDIVTRSIAAGKKTSDDSGGENASGGENKKYFEQMANAFKDFSKNYAKNLENLGKSLKSNYSEEIDAFIKEMESILGQDLPDDLKAALEGLTIDVTSNPVTPEPVTSSEKVANNGAVIGSTIASNTGEIGSLVNAIINNGIWGAIAEILGHIMARIEEVSPIFSWIQNIFSEIFELLINEDSGIITALEDFLQPFLDGFNALKDILGGFLQLIVGILNSMKPTFEGATMILNKIAPIITSILEVLGLLFNIVGVVGEMLNPILEIVLNVLAPFLEIINYVIKAIYSIIAHIVNVVISIYNAMVWWGKMNYISTEMNTKSTVTGGYEAFTPAITATDTTVATTSGSASYTAAKDIYVNVYYNNSYVNGDAREIALSIREEIRNAERLGY